MNSRFRPVIEALEDKCVNCRDCVAACPVKTCIDVAGEKPLIRPELCIGCGSCIIACGHGARRGLDDSLSFLAAIKRHDKLVAVVAPAAAAHFPGDTLRLNSWLTAMGVEAVFDLAFAAESALRSLIGFMKDTRPEMVIAQSCPAVVSYLELYRPELLPFLAPTDTPMLRAMNLIAERSPELARHAIVVISPCVSKRREFDKADKEIHNVTIEGLEKLFEAEGVRLADYPERAYDGPGARGELILSSPGGFKATLERDAPDMIADVKVIAGAAELYPYLANRPAPTRGGQVPFIVDCLNCEQGCNGGTGTGLTYSPRPIPTR